MFAFGVFALAAILLAVVVVFLGAKRFQGCKFTFECSGCYIRTSDMGLHPIRLVIGRKVSMTETVFEVSAQETIAKTNAMIRSGVSAFWFPQNKPVYLMP